MRNSKLCIMLADEMGLGKTYVALAIAAWILQESYSCQNIEDHVERKLILVVCPTSLVHNWENFAKTLIPHCSGRTHVIASSSAEREAVRLLNMTDFLKTVI